MKDDEFTMEPFPHEFNEVYEECFDELLVSSEPMESPLRLKDFNGLANLHEQTTKELETLASIIRHNIETETRKMTQTIEITSDEKK